MARQKVLTPPATVHGHAILRAPRTKRPRGLFVGFHGYGENAEGHLEHLRGIPGIDKWWVLAIQALHPFYDRKMTNVVASWMTRFDRERAIADNQKYVVKTIQYVIAENEIEGPLVVEGFSQGVAMAFRAAIDRRLKPAGVIALAGDIPPDVIEKGFKKFPPVLMGRGTRDRIISSAIFDADVTTLEWAEVDVTNFQYRGGHRWGDEFREAVGEFLCRVEKSDRGR